MKGFELDERTLLKLKRFHRKEKRQWAADRIKAVVLLGSGWTYVTTSKALLLDIETLRSYVRKYSEGGLLSLLQRHHKGGKSRLSQDDKQELKAHLSEYTYADVAQIRHYVKKRFGVDYKATQMRTILSQLGFVYKKPKLVPGKVDPVAAMNHLKRYETIRREGKPLYFMDGTHPQHNSMPSHGWILKGSEKALLSNTGRSRLNINGAVNIDSHELITRTDESVNAQSTINLFKQILKKHRNDDKIYIVCDNAGYYRSKLVQSFVKETKKIELVFLPPYSPFFNLIERIWRYFKKCVLYNRYYESFDDFKYACKNFLKRKHKRAFKKLLTEKFHFGRTLEVFKPIFTP